MKRLDNKIALVTGGASGLGKAIARRLRAEGARVVITDVQSALGIATADQEGLTFLEQDVCSETRWNEVIQEIEAQFGDGCLDVLVNNAGIIGDTESSNPEKAKLADWTKTFSVNVEGVFLGCRAGIAAMRRANGGSIINVSSIAALLATPTSVAYGASKAAVRHLTKSVAQYCAEERLNIRCNSVHPGLVQTPLLDKAHEDFARARGAPLSTVLADQRRRIPLGDFTTADDIASAVAYLASADARHITGSKFVVDGGMVGCVTYRSDAATLSTNSNDKL